MSQATKGFAPVTGASSGNRRICADLAKHVPAARYRATAPQWAATQGRRQRVDATT